MYKPLIYKGVDLSQQYLVSDNGQIYSLKTNKILKQHVNKNGYSTICVSIGTRKNKILIRIHDAVGYNFVDGYQEGFEINHKNGNKQDNNATNLEWISHQYNIIHSWKTGLRKDNVRVKCNETGEIFNTLKDAEQWCGIKSKYNLWEYLHNPKRKTAGKHPITKEPLTWTLID